MNQNRITNIIERGGVEGWETVSLNIMKQFYLQNDSNISIFINKK